MGDVFLWIWYFFYDKKLFFETNLLTTRRETIVKKIGYGRKELLRKENFDYFSMYYLNFQNLLLKLINFNFLYVRLWIFILFLLYNIINF